MQLLSPAVCEQEQALSLLDSVTAEFQELHKQARPARARARSLARPLTAAVSRRIGSARA